jgi:hypothetical protein
MMSKLVPKVSRKAQISGVGAGELVHDVPCVGHEIGRSMMKVALLVVVAILHGGHYGRGLGWEVLMCGVVCWVGCVVVCTRIESVRMMGGLLLACLALYKVSDNLNVPKAV